MKTYQFERRVKELESSELDLTERTIPFEGGMIKLFYISQLTDRPALSESVVRPLVLYCSSRDAHPTAQSALDGVIYADSCWLESDGGKILDTILTGMVVILFSSDDQYLVVNLKCVVKRSVPTPQLNYTVRGPQDCFTENLDTNLSLIRYRLKDKGLRIQYLEVGVRTKTRVAVIYIEDIANDVAVGEIMRRIRGIHVEGIGESGELQAFLLNNEQRLFPQMGIIERSDMACHTLMDGKVLVLADGGCVAVYAPKTFSEFFYSCDDRYDNKYFGLFSRILRYLSMAIGVTASSLYVAITSFHTEVLPSDYVILLAQLRVNVPFSAMIGALILEFIVELLREALLRVPKQIGPAIGIVGAIVIGQAAIAAGFFSPVLLTIVAVSLLASFAIPDYTLVTPFRILKFMLILSTGTLGFFGFTAFTTVIATELVSINSFGVPYMSPWAPLNKQDAANTLMDHSTTRVERPHYLRSKDKVRLRK